VCYKTEGKFVLKSKYECVGKRWEQAGLVTYRHHGLKAEGAGKGSLLGGLRLVVDLGKASLDELDGSDNSGGVNTSTLHGGDDLQKHHKVSHQRTSLGLCTCDARPGL
jgi:hypothetical protein